MNHKLVTLGLLAVLLAGCQQPKETDLPPTATPDRPDVHVQHQRLGRGVNLGNALEAPREGEWGVTLEESYFQLIGQAGFDTVRVPIRWSAHADQEPPYTIDETFFKRVDWAIEQALANDLNVVINMHHYEAIFDDPRGQEERFIEMWKQIAARYKDMPDTFYLEPLNEPHDQLTAARWNDMLPRIIDAIRDIDERHTLIIGSADWGGVYGLKSLRIPQNETNVIATFHFYTPMLFTHQGAEWMDDEYGTLGVIWPAPPENELKPTSAASKVTWVKTWFHQYNHFPAETNPGGPQPLLDELDQAQQWSEQHGIPLWMGEFGAYSKADMQSRANWTRFMREEAEKRGFTWAYWEFCAGFGVYDPGSRQWNQELLDALLPGR